MSKYKNCKCGHVIDTGWAETHNDLCLICYGKAEKAEPEPCEFWQAQYQTPSGKWYRLSGTRSSVDGVRKDIEEAKKNREITNAFLGDDGTRPVFRIRHFVGTVETVA